jgi:tetratricopeptide (TPR) repeat protein
VLIHIPQWDLNWQAVYRYENPVRLPKGTTVLMRYSYDNSTDNVANPNNPPRRVVAGNRSSDEMAHLWLQVLPRASNDPKSDPRMLILEALARHNIEKNPADFEAHYNLAAILQAQGAQTEALQQFTLAVKLRPQDATANNAVGASLLSTGQVDEAIHYLQAALNAQPNNFDAHYNLANAFVAQNRFADAVEQFRAATRLRPDDANAEANLGSALAVTGELGEAREHFRRALRLDPNNKLARENLEQIGSDPKVQQ